MLGAANNRGILARQGMPEAKFLTNTAVNGMQDALTTSVQSWLDTHPILQWMLAHPFLTGGILLLALMLVWGLVRAIARFTEQVWLFILQSPIKLGRWLWSLVVSLLKLPATFMWTKPQSAASSHQERLQEILSRLEVIKQEQDALLQEMKTILTLPVTQQAIELSPSQQDMNGSA